jgi:hypothetical protein
MAVANVYKESKRLAFAAGEVPKEPQTGRGPE